MNYLMNRLYCYTERRTRYAERLNEYTNAREIVKRDQNILSMIHYWKKATARGGEKKVVEDGGLSYRSSISGSRATGY